MPKVNAEICFIPVHRHWAIFFYLGPFGILGGGLSVVLCRIPLKYFLDSSQFDLFLMFRGSLDVSTHRFSGLSYFSTESLILAQDERWRRA